MFILMYMPLGGMVSFDSVAARWMFLIWLHAVTYCLVAGKVLNSKVLSLYYTVYFKNSAGLPQ
jgi:hypothetical protein